MAPYTSSTIIFLGPWAPMVRVYSTSPVLLGPERNEMFRGAVTITGWLFLLRAMGW